MTIKKEIWFPALATFISALIAALITLLGAFWNLQAIEEQIRIQNKQIYKQQQQINDKFLFEKKSAYIEMEDLYQEIHHISKGIDGDLKILNHKYKKENKSRNLDLKNFSQIKTNKETTEQVKTIYSYILRNAQKPITLTNNEKIHLSNKARSAIKNMNKAYEDLAYIIKLRKKSIGTWHALNMKGHGMLHSFYDIYFKKHLDILGHDLERLRREAYSFKKVSSLKEWKKGVEIIPSEGKLMFKNHRFPICEAKYETLFITKEPKENLQFICEDGPSNTELSFSKSKIRAVVTALSLWNINMLKQPTNYYDLFYKLEDPSEGIHFILQEPW